MRVVDEDVGNADDHVDDIYVDVSLSVSSSFTTQTDFYGDHGNSRIRLSFRVQCSANYYGSDCATYCVNTDDSTGHYTCGTGGTKNCLAGWTGSECNTGKRTLKECWFGCIFWLVLFLCNPIVFPGNELHIHTNEYVYFMPYMEADERAAC